MEPYEKVERSKKQIIINNFLGGISWGLGVTIGLSILLGIIGFAISKIDFVPIVGNIISDSFETTLKNGPPLR